jgi:hypothetical protein
MRESESLRSFLKSRFPRAVAVYQNAAEALTRPSLATIFSSIYRNNAWQDPESVSGRGSTLARTNAIMDQLPALLQEFHADVLLDAPCGDFNWMRYTNLGKVRYVGVDIVPDLIRKNQELYDEPGRIEFLVADISKDPLPRAQAILCRDCLIHLSYSRIKSVISNFKTSGAKYLLCTTHTSITNNVDCLDGGWRSLNLQLEPFNFPEPLKLIVEDAEVGKCLGVWQFSEL